MDEKVSGAEVEESCRRDYGHDAFAVAPRFGQACRNQQHTKVGSEIADDMLERPADPGTEGNRERHPDRKPEPILADFFPERSLHSAVQQNSDEGNRPEDLKDVCVDPGQERDGFVQKADPQEDQSKRAVKGKPAHE
jgi:hypothetical protein